MGSQGCTRRLFHAPEELRLLHEACGGGVGRGLVTGGQGLICK